MAVIISDTTSNTNFYSFFVKRLIDSSNSFTTQDYNRVVEQMYMPTLSIIIFLIFIFILKKKKKGKKFLKYKLISFFFNLYLLIDYVRNCRKLNMGEIPK